MKDIILTLYTVSKNSLRYVTVRRASIIAENADEMLAKIREMKDDCSKYANEYVAFMTMSTSHYDFPGSEILKLVTPVNVQELFDN